VRLALSNLPVGTRVENGTPLGDGAFGVRHDYPVGAGERVRLLLEFYVPDRRVLEGVEIRVDTSVVLERGLPEVVVLEIDRRVALADGRFLVEFGTRVGWVYWVQYSEDLVGWWTADPPVTGTGSRVQWIDGGPPKTHRHPADEPGRFYRVLEARAP
jgi:hypothetical protein